MNTPKIVKEGFVERLETLLLGRQKHPWGAALGSNSGTVNRMFQGTPPTAETLIAICKTENVNLSWLLAGKGEKYITQRFSSDQDTAVKIEQALKISDAKHYLFFAPTGFVTAHAYPDTLSVKENEIHYWALDLVTAHFDKESWAVLMKNSHKLDLLSISEEEYQDLVCGNLGTCLLLGNEEQKGLIQTADKKPKLSEKDFEIPEAKLSKEEANLLSGFAGLPQKAKNSVIDLVNSFSTGPK